MNEIYEERAHLPRMRQSDANISLADTRFIATLIVQAAAATIHFAYFAADLPPQFSGLR